MARLLMMLALLGLFIGCAPAETDTSATADEAAEMATEAASETGEP